MINLTFLLYLFPGLVIGLTFHEAAHAYSAMLLGDKTAYKMGRVSLDPLRHLSPLGTLALFFLGFGWGKPVLINVFNFERPRRDYLLSSLAGPGANLIICLIVWLLLRLPMPDQAKAFLVGTYLINGVLAMLNLIPISPLDGSKIWPCIIPGMKIVNPSRFRMTGLVILLLLVFTGGIAMILEPVLGFMMDALMDKSLVNIFYEVVKVKS
jgi:Zn-dependent protease